MALASSLLTSTQPLEHAVLTSVHPGVQRSVVMRCGAEVPYIFHVASDNALLSCPRSSYTISSEAEMGVPLQSRVRASPARGHRAQVECVALDFPSKPWAHTGNSNRYDSDWATMGKMGVITRPLTLSFEQCVWGGVSSFSIDTSRGWRDNPPNRL